MHKKSSAYFKLLAGLFHASEIAYLQKQPHFHFALDCVRSFDDFDRLCAICHRLLARREEQRLAA